MTGKVVELPDLPLIIKFFEGGFTMTFLKRHGSDIFLVGLGAIMLTTLAWDWSNIKSFISGGVIAVCLTIKAMR